MYKKSSIQTKSFVILLSIAVLGTFFSLITAYKVLSPKYWDMSQRPKDFNSYKTVDYGKNDAVKQVLAAEAEPTINTSSWKEYVNTKYSFSFKYNPDWKILSAKQSDGFEVIEIDPGAKYYNIKLYISDQGYYVMDGLPTQEVELNGQKAIAVSDLLYGVQKNSIYFTLDLGRSLSLKPQFNALVKSLTFN